MSLASKLGSLVMQNLSVSNGHGSLASMYNDVRCMSRGMSGGSKHFTGGLSYNTDDQQLKEAFDSFGEVTEARFIMDRDTGRSRGFGFVGYTSKENASQALSSMDGQDLGGRSIRVSYANERPPRTGGYGNSG
ncbi:hypothetical protein MKX01_030111 [Papaver californicum]|nr:hypothetical protein MKX01_030111 [Papaver californicum]